MIFVKFNFMNFNRRYFYIPNYYFFKFFKGAIMKYFYVLT